MRVIASSVLAFEAVVVLLAIPVAISLGGVDASTAAIVGGALMVLCVLVAGSLGRPWGYTAGWVVQALIVLSGFVVTAMFFVGGLFAALWWIGLVVGRRGEQIASAGRVDADDPRSGSPDAPG